MAAAGLSLLASQRATHVGLKQAAQSLPQGVQELKKLFINHLSCGSNQQINSKNNNYGVST